MLRLLSHASRPGWTVHCHGITRRLGAAHGAALLEAIVASGLVVVLMGGLWPLVLGARYATSAARHDVVAGLAATQRLSEVAALTHLRSSVGIVRDEDTSLGTGQPFVGGGTGLRERGVTPLDTPEAGASDWLDEHGGWERAGPAPGPSAHYLRQWALVTGEAGCVQVWVRVTVPNRAGGVLASGLQCPWGVDEP